MCASGAALVAAPGSAPGGLGADAVLTCTTGAGGNATAWTGRPCNSQVPPSFPGYACACSRAAGGQFQLRAGGDVGLATGAAAPAWRARLKCLRSAQDVMGAPCQFDSPDLSAPRVGSCAYYGCAAQYATVVAALAAPAWTPPLVNWADVAACEVDAAGTALAALPATPCAILPNLEQWKCVPPAGTPTVAGTSGLVAVIIIGIILAFVLHMYLHRKENKTWIPFVSN